MRWPSLVPLAASLVLVLVACATQQAARAPEPRAEAKEDIAPEHGTGLRVVALARAERFLVAAAHPEAARAGTGVLARGGTALDAAIAVQAMLTLVEPQSSGIGGGAFLLYWDAAAQQLTAWDGRETAPAAADETLFLDAEGAPLGFLEAVVGGRSVGVPGVVRMLFDAHGAHGALPWAGLFDDAIALSEAGFPVYPRLLQQLERDPALRTLSPAREYFYDDEGEPRARLVNPALAATLRLLAAGGAAPFYEGELARDMVGAVRATAAAPGLLSVEDLAGYRALRRDAVCLPYRSARVCGMPPPTSGGVTTLQILGLLERFPMGSLAPRSLEAAHLFAEAGRLAFADRDLYLADPDFVDVPMAGLLDPAYLASRSGLIDPARAASGVVAAGMPVGAPRALAAAPSQERPSTSHFVIVDEAGNVASMTTSVENVFGSRVMVRGFLLNNQLTDFAFVPSVDGRPVANRLEPGKRPRSSMAPMLVFNAQGRPRLALGSPGGSRIIPFVARALMGVLDWDLDVQEAISLPHVSNRNGATELEDTLRTPEELAALRAGLEALGHEVWVGDMNSGLHAVELKAHGLEGGADPRRAGAALGE
jgi:gamma-glutamyltranspeptidase / glutathione hydrolase